MNIALMSHDRKKELMVQFCIAYCGILSKHTICATNTTGRLVSEATGLPVQLFLSHEHGGSQQIGARIAYNEIDMVLFFNDPQSGDLDAHPRPGAGGSGLARYHQSQDQALYRVTPTPHRPRQDGQAARAVRLFAGKEPVMKRSQILAAAGAAAALILLVLTLRQVSALREEVDGLRDRLLQMEQSLTDGISGIDNAVRRELETQGSLFSASDTTLDYRDGALVLTASVLPKEVRADETLTLSAGGVSAPMAAGADGVYTAELTLPLAAESSPQRWPFPPPPAPGRRRWIPCGRETCSPPPAGWSSPIRIRWSPSNKTVTAPAMWTSPPPGRNKD